MVRKVQHHIFFRNDIHNPTRLRQKRMNKRLGTRVYIRKNLPREVHKVFKIVNSTAGNHMILLVQTQSLHHKLQQIRINLLVVYKTCCLSFFTIFDTLLQIVDQIGMKIVIQIQFSITRYFDQMTHEFIKPKWSKQIR